MPIAAIHVVSKHDHTKHAVTGLPLELPPLAPSSVRIRASLVTLTKNNLAYALRGGVLGWWYAFPVSTSLPPPYNEAGDWCIVPAWGIAEVIESNVDGIAKDSRLYGLWPLSSYHHDLTLVGTETPGHFREISEHRKPLMNLYNRFILVDEVLKPKDDGRFAALFTSFGAGYLLNRFVLPFDTKQEPIHPLGNGAGKWGREDSDLTSTVVVGLSTSSKTGRMFSWGLSNARGPNNAPIGYLQLSSALNASEGDDQGLFPTKSMTYNDLDSSEVGDWVAALKPARVLLVDFGARIGVIERFLGSVSAKLPDTMKFVILALATRQDIVQNPSSVAGKHLTKGQTLNAVQVNHSGIQDSAMTGVGAGSVYQGWKSGFDCCIEKGEAKSFQIVEGTGMRGKNGIEGAWEDLASGRISSENALVFHI